MKRYLPIAIVVVIAAFLRLRHLGAQSLWFDEALTLWLCKLPYRELIGNLRFFDQTPPLNHVLTGWFVAIFGDSEAVLRLPSALAGIGAVIAAYAVARRIAGETAGVLAALLLAFCPFAIDYSKEARPYSLLLLFSLLSTHAFLLLLENPRLQNHRRARVYYILVGALLLYTHPFGIMILGCHFLAYVFAHVRRQTTLKPSAYAAALAIIAVLYLPWIPILRIALAQTTGRFWIPPAHFFDIPAAYWIYTNSILALIGMTICAVFGAAFIRRLYGGVAIILLALAPVIIPMAVSLAIKPIFTWRYGIGAVGALCILAGCGLASLPALFRYPLFAAIVLSMTFGPGFAPETFGFDRHRTPWREIGARLHDELPRGALVLYSPGSTAIQFNYYVRRDDLRQVPFREWEHFPAVVDDRFWLIVSYPQRTTYHFLATGGYRVVSARVNEEMMILEMGR